MKHTGSKTVSILFLATLSLTSDFAIQFGHGADLPDPTALLQGVEAARLQIPPSRLLIRAIYRSPSHKSNPELVVEFDGDRRHFAVENGDALVRSLFDGSKAIHFDGADSVTLRDTSNPTADYNFDPRLLGITTTYSWGETLAIALPYRSASTIQTIGREQVGDRTAWHVQVSDTANQKFDLWIDDQNGFRVYRYDFTTPSTNRNTTLSFYENKDYPWLPSRIEGRVYDAAGNLTRQREITMLKAEANVPLPDKTWTLAGLNVPVGLAVADLRIKQRVGYWDGTGLSDQVASPRHGAIKPGLRIASYVLIGTLLLLPLGLLGMAKMRRREIQA